MYGFVRFYTGTVVVFSVGCTVLYACVRVRVLCLISGGCTLLYAFVRVPVVCSSRVGVSPGSGRGEDARSVYTMHGRLAVWLGAEYRRYADPFAQTGPFRMLRLLGLHDFPKPEATVQNRTYPYVSESEERTVPVQKPYVTVHAIVYRSGPNFHGSDGRIRTARTLWKHKPLE